MIPTLPDMDALVTEALRSGLPGVAVRVSVPADWLTLLPLVTALRVGGVSPDPRGIDRALVDVQALAATRREASAVARSARVTLASACRTQFRGSDGYLTHFEEVSGPRELSTGEPDDGPDLFRFQATYRLTSRPITP
ncbi:phage tail termination protein [Streptomyces gossypii]|uniref:phage tail termination protein n=1 Tax=Streptomyces gossypii TaxID=2883101 RepID=UPI00405641F1